MSFKFAWTSFSPEFINTTRQQLTLSLNRGQKASNIVGDISVSSLDLGSLAPELELLGIDELPSDISRFKGLYRLSYNGDASLVLDAHVQANPLKLPIHQVSIISSPYILAANKPLVVPIQIRIADIRLKGIISLVVDVQEGVTITFKNDPLENVNVSSSFDTVDAIKRFLQAQIEDELRQLFNHELPQMIHNLSIEFQKSKRKSVDSTKNVLHKEISSDSTLYEDQIDSYISLARTRSESKWIGNEQVEPSSIVVSKSFELDSNYGFGSLTLPTSGSKLSLSYHSEPCLQRTDQEDIQQDNGLSFEYGYKKNKKRSRFRKLKYGQSSLNKSHSGLFTPINSCTDTKDMDEPILFTKPICIHPHDTYVSANLSNLLSLSPTMTVVSRELKNLIFRSNPNARSPIKKTN